MDIKHLLKSKHPKYLKLMYEKEMYEAEERQLDDWVKEAWECPHCVDLREHMEKCVH